MTSGYVSLARAALCVDPAADSRWKTSANTRPIILRFLFRVTHALELRRREAFRGI